MNDEMSLSKDELEEIWRKGEVILGVNPKFIRRDIYGNWIKRNDFNNIHSSFGWTVSSVKIQKFGEGEYYETLMPVHWKHKE